MASTNQSPFYKKAEEKYLNAQNDNEKLYWLDEMIKECPKHKSAEKMLANLKTRRIKLLEKIERIKKSKKTSNKPGIKKGEMQVVLVGFTNSGKSSLLSVLTNAKPVITEYPYSTNNPEIGTMEYGGVKFQIIDEPSFKNENFDVGILNNTDLILIVITNLNEIKESEIFLEKTHGKKIIVLNKIDLISENEKRKLSETLKSKKMNFVMVSTLTKEGIEELKEKIFSSFNIIRVYLKEPGKSPGQIPLTIKSPALIKDVAEKIGKNFLKSIKEIHIWGPSSKFPNQKVGFNHEIKDKDIVEFKTR
ncbi:MAG: GTP-binding protein [Candidatus Pacearchaeota archaeon]